MFSKPKTSRMFNMTAPTGLLLPIVVQCQDEKFPSCLNKQFDGQNNKAVNNSHLERDGRLDQTQSKASEENQFDKNTNVDLDLKIPKHKF